MISAPEREIGKKQQGAGDEYVYSTTAHNYAVDEFGACNAALALARFSACLRIL